MKNNSPCASDREISTATGVAPEPSTTARPTSCQYRIYSPFSPPLNSTPILPPPSPCILLPSNLHYPCSFAPVLELPRRDKVQTQIPVVEAAANQPHAGAASGSTSDPAHESTPAPAPAPEAASAIAPASGVTSCSLNRSDWTEVQAHRSQLTLTQTRFLDMILPKQSFYRFRYDDPDYLARSSMLVLSDWGSAKRYCFCGVPTKVNSSGRCGLRQFCPYCAYLEQRPRLLEFVPAFHRATWHFVTLSFSGAHPFDGPANAHSCLQHWDSCKSALRGALADRSIQGAFWSEELAILRFLPLHVMPHTHALILSDSLSEHFGEDLAQAMSRNLAGLENPMVPDVDVQPVLTPRSLYDRVCYMFKPINIVRPYDTAWPLASADQRAGAWKINSQLRVFLTGHTQLGARESSTGRRKKVERIGLLHPQKHGYLGIPPAERAEHRDYVDSVGAENQDEEQALSE